jgi:ABC-type tungstate transport system substrate-binding protein
MSYLAEQMALFGIVVGFALLLAGLGFGIMILGGALRGDERAMKPASSAAPKHGVVPVAPTV